MSKILVGADPELFLQQRGRIISAIDMLQGDKVCPYPTPFGGVQVDNVLAEFNITPAGTEDEFVNNVQRTLVDMHNMLPDGVDFDIRASHVYDMDYLQSVGPRAFMFGCNPDYNVYTGKKQVVRCDNPALRSAGGHIHLGGPEVVKNREAIIQALDYLIALPSVLMEPDVARRSLYGRAGSYRPKPYGLEYRTPSNFWIKTEGRMRWAYRQAIRAVEEYSRVPEWSAILPFDELQDIINSSNVKSASYYGDIYGEVA